MLLLVAEVKWVSSDIVSVRIHVSKAVVITALIALPVRNIPFTLCLVSTHCD